uniref:Uncharacterized protein n=1 Tax=Arundo donax TaxID=35708 RepID=A0A0A9BZK3_ARUDO
MSASVATTSSSWSDRTARRPRRLPGTRSRQEWSSSEVSVWQLYTGEGTS